MSTPMFNTGNPVGSVAPEDRSDNTQVFDKVMNGDDKSYINRLGKLIYSLAWMQTAATGIPAIEAAIRAENARDAILLSQGGIFLTVGDGMAATPVGKYFNVIDPDPSGYLTLYQNVAGVATVIKKYPSTSMIEALNDIIGSLATTAGSMDATVFIDAMGFTLMKLLSDGSLDMRGANIGSADGQGLVVSDKMGFSMARFGPKDANILGLSIESRPDVKPGLYFVDSMGFCAGKFASDGCFFGPQAKEEKEVAELPPVGLLAQQVRTGIMQVVGDGQSLSVGVTSRPAISVVQNFNNVMMKSGIRSRYNAFGYDPELVPLREEDSVLPLADNQGETPIAGMVNGFVKRMVDMGEDPADWVMAGMAAGRSGWAVEQLSPHPLGTAGVWEQMCSMIRDMKAQADALGKTYSVWAYQWLQGESNYKVEYTNSQYLYTQYLMELWDKFTVEILKITGQVFRPYMFTYQVAGHRKYSRDYMSIALSQWALSKSRPDVVLAAPCYQFAVSADNLHLTNESSWLIGEYFARAMHVTMGRKTSKWRPLEPVSVDWQSDTILIKYHVPGGKVVIDTALCAQARNQGFDVRDANDAIVDGAIASVSVKSVDTVEVKLAADKVGDAFRLTYARGADFYSDPKDSGPVRGARGNVRDTMGDYDKVTSPLGNTFDMHNASVMFQYDRKNGFF